MKLYGNLLKLRFQACLLTDFVCGAELIFF
jgi:hypothetical protein